MQKKINNYYSNKEIKAGGYYTFENVFHISFLLCLINLSISGRNSDRCIKVIVSGHQRVRACKELGITEILAETKHYKSEDDIIKDLLETNIRQRGTVGGSEKKLTARIDELKAEERMKSGKTDPRQTFGKGVRTDEVVAEKLGIGSKETYRKEKFIYENQSSLPPEDFADWDEGRLSTNKAYQQIKAKLQQQEEQLKTKQDSVDLLNT